MIGLAWWMGCVGQDAAEAEPEPAPALVFAEPPRNLLVLSMDTTRRDRVDRYAPDGVERTPFLASLLDRSVVLDDHVQCSNWTFPSMFCTTTGAALEEGGFFPRTSEPGRVIPEGQRTLARMLSERGFLTLLATSNTFFSAQVGNTQGFDAEWLSVDASTVAVAAAGVGELEARVVDEPDRRWYLHLHVYEPHAPYLPPPEHLDLEGAPSVAWDMSTEFGQLMATRAYASADPETQAAIRWWLEAGYSGELRSMDAQLATVWQDLEARGLLEDTLVVLLTDHGEAFWEHGVTTHGWFLTSEENAGVLAFWGRTLEPLAWRGPTHGADLVPTVLDALDLPIPQEVTGTVVGLAPRGRPRFTATAAYGGPWQAVTVDGWRLMYGWAGLARLWHLEDDPVELDDLSASEPERFDELWALLEPRVRLMQALVPEEVPAPPTP